MRRTYWLATMLLGAVLAASCVAPPTTRTPKPATDGSTSRRIATKKPSPTPGPLASDDGAASTAVEPEASGELGLGDRPIIFSLEPTIAAPGQIVTIAGELFGQEGEELKVTMSGVEATGVTRESAQTIKATVPDGAVTGDVEVSVAGRKSDRVRLSVISSLGDITPTVSELKVGAEKTLAVTALDASRRELGGANVAWSSSDTGVLDVDASGVIEGQSPGSATVTAKIGSLTKTTTVSVVAYTVLVETLAGGGTTPAFNAPLGLAIDASGVIWVADSGSHVIRRVSAAGAVTPFAGSGTAGEDDGTDPLAATFNTPADLAPDGAGGLVIADQLSHELRMVAASGEVSSLAGSDKGYQQDADPLACRLDSPLGVAVDASGVVYVADTKNHVIRALSSDRTSFTTVAGTAGAAGAANLTGTAASFSAPGGLAIGSDGALYVADTGNHLIRRVDLATFAVTTFAGAGQGLVEGARASAKFNAPRDLAFDASGNLYVADTGNHRIRRIATDGQVTTAAGSSEGFAEGSGTQAKFKQPSGVAVDAQGRILVSDTGNNRLRRITIQP